MYLIFDTETTGLPKNWKAPLTNLSNWPRMIQIGWILYDHDGNEIEVESYIIKPKGFSIPPDAQRVHGISTEQAEKEGQDLRTVLKNFLNVLNRAEYLVAHNISFDEKIIGAEFLRENMTFDSLVKIKKICTKEASTNYCKLPGNYGYKWPSLSELYFKLFNTHLKEAHNAEVDVRTCGKCFFELKQRGVIKF